MSEQLPYKLGCLPAKRPAALEDLAVYAQGKLPSPPPSVKVPHAPYPLLGNATHGDCVVAGAIHLSEAWNVDFEERDTIPDGEEAVRRYLQLTGDKDTGLVESDFLKVWYEEGNFNTKIAGYAPVAPNDTLAIHQVVAFYGGAMLGISCPRSAEEQFSRGEPWTYVPNSAILGGHCIVALGYTQTALLCATWGGIAVVTAGFLAHFLDEAWCVLSRQLVERRGDDLGIDLKALREDLTRV